MASLADGYCGLIIRASHEYALDMYPLWARIKGLPDGLTRRKESAEKVAAKVGDPPFSVIMNEGRINPASTLRVRVYVDVNSSLVRFVPITLKEYKRYNFYYENLTDFCFSCGKMGHVADECGDGIHDPRTCEWGSWLLWNGDPVRYAMGGRGMDGGSRGGRTGGQRS